MSEWKTLAFNQRMGKASTHKRLACRFAGFELEQIEYEQRPAPIFSVAGKAPSVLLRGAAVLTMDAGDRLLADTDVLVEQLYEVQPLAGAPDSARICHLRTLLGAAEMLKLGVVGELGSGHVLDRLQHVLDQGAVVFLGEDK